MQSFVNLCTAAGIDVSRLELFDAYLIAGKIIQDFELFKRAIAMREPNSGAILQPGLREEALAAMTQAERAAFRERVLAGMQFKQS